jgi:hypothetical protein
MEMEDLEKLESANKSFVRLIDAAMAFCREAGELASTSPDHQKALQAIASKAARLELRINWTPMPSVTAAVIRDSDGELLGHFFEHSARVPIAH